MLDIRYLKQAVTVMSDSDAEDFWEIIKGRFRTSWDE